jgi:hypothetical protein
MTRACELEFQGRLVYPGKTPFLLKEQMKIKQLRKSWQCRTVKTIIIGTNLPLKNRAARLWRLGS